MASAGGNTKALDLRLEARRGRRRGRKKIMLNQQTCTLGDACT